MNGSIFISYRRDGGSWSTRTLHDRLVARFGAGRVFMDITDIDYGSDFADRIADAVGRCDVLLAIITPQWLGLTDAAGARRLDNPEDYVRLEIGMGLRRRIPVIPILVDGAQMPGEADLPDDLKPLSRRNAVEIRHSHFDSDIGLLIEALTKALGEPQPEPPAVGALLQRFGLVGGAALALLVLLAAVLLMRDGDPPPDTRNASAGDGGIAVSGDNVTINQTLDPALLQLVENAVGRLTEQLENKDAQIRVRDEQTRQLSAAVAALAEQAREPDAPSMLADALASLRAGDTQAAKTVFREILETKSALARTAAGEAATAAQHLGALAVLDDEKEAAEAYRRAVELDPANPVAREQLALLDNTPGSLRLQATLVEGGDPVSACYTVYHAKQDIDGNREVVRYTCDNPARVTVNTGRYYVWAAAGDAGTGREFEVTAGGLVNEVLNLDGGQLRLQATLVEGGDPVSACYTVYHAKQDIDGNREVVRYTCDNPARVTLNSGNYYVTAKADAGETAQAFELGPGQLIDRTLILRGD